MFQRASTVGPAAAAPPAAVRSQLEPPAAAESQVEPPAAARSQVESPAAARSQAESPVRSLLLQELARAFSLGFLAPPSAAYVWRMPERRR